MSALEELLLRYDVSDRAVMVKLCCGCGLCRVDHRAHPVLRYETSEVRRRTERPSVNLGQPECCIVGGHHDVGVTDEPDPPSQAEPVHGCHDGHLAVVDRSEGGRTSPVHSHEGLVTPGLDLLYVCLLYTSRCV